MSTDRQQLLSTEDVREITGLQHNQLEEFCQKGIAVNVGGDGHWKDRRFAVQDAVALAYGATWFQFGLTYDLVKQVVNCVRGFTEEQLLAEFAANRKVTLLLPGAEAQLTEAPPGKLPEVLDLERVYRRVKRQLHVIEVRKRQGQPPAPSKRLILRKPPRSIQMSAAQRRGLESGANGHVEVK